MTNTIDHIEQLILEYADCRDELDSRKMAVEVYSIATKNIVEEIERISETHPRGLREVRIINSQDWADLKTRLILRERR